MCEKSTANIIFNCERPHAPQPQDQEQGKDICSNYFFLNIVLEGLTRTIMQEKEIKDSRLERKNQNYLFSDDVF